ncbi:MAG TPA: hypothetical protein VGO00_02605, partial [Kofleriaceae bacterium]|nr:hypothetical protein [Kofleriaceae bacterium]
MIELAASETELVMMARALVAPDDHEPWMTRELAPKISPVCAELVGDALRQLWPSLWRRGGARPGASIRDGGVVRGRPWERHAPQGLVHTAATIAVLRWLVESRLGTRTVATLPARPVAVGDQVVIYLALDTLREPSAQRAFASQPLVRAAPLAWLGFAQLFDGNAPQFDELAHGVGAIVVEALAAELARRWELVELSKRGIVRPGDLEVLGAVQDATLGGFMDACDRHRRRDLAGFIIDAAAPMLARDLPPFPEALDNTTPLSVRAAVRPAAGALLRAIVRWGDWDREHRGVRFIDDDYAASQLLLARFEAVGTPARAITWLGELAS